MAFFRPTRAGTGRIRTAAVAGLAVLALAACEGSAPITSAPVSVTPTGNPVLQGVIGFEPTEVRAYQDRAELAGVACDIAGVGYTANVVTPGLVNLPDQRAQSQPVTATCRKDEAVRTVVVQPFSRTASNNRQTAQANGGILGVVFSGVVEGVRDKTNDDWAYPMIRAEFD